MLIITKLKIKAQHWLHAHPTRMLEPFERLCEQLIMAEVEAVSQVQASSNGSRPSFAMYFKEKPMLAQRINLDTNELLEQIIEGVPSATLREQL